MISKWIGAAIIITTPLLGHGASADAAEVKVLCANGMRAVLTELHPQLERTTGQRVTMSFGEAGDLRKRILDGEMVDVIVLPRVVLDQLLTQDKICARHGYIYNQNGEFATSLRVLAQALDPTGAVVGQRVAYVPGGVGGFGRVYFEVPNLPVTENYRVSVWDYTWFQAPKNAR